MWDVIVRLVLVFAYFGWDTATPTTRPGVELSAAQESATTELAEGRSTVDPRDTESKTIERELVGWKSKSAKHKLPEARVLAPDLVVEGRWWVRRGLDGSFLEVSRTGPASFSVRFSTHGCLGGWHLERTATYDNGVLQLNRPLREYFPLTYDRLYAIRVDGNEYLISQEGVDKLHGKIGAGRDRDGIVDRFYFFSREDAKARTATQPTGENR